MSDSFCMLTARAHRRHVAASTFLPAAQPMNKRQRRAAAKAAKAAALAAGEVNAAAPAPGSQAWLQAPIMVLLTQQLTEHILQLQI